MQEIITPRTIVEEIVRHFELMGAAILDDRRRNTFANGRRHLGKFNLALFHEKNSSKFVAEYSM